MFHSLRRRIYALLLAAVYAASIPFLASTFVQAVG